MALGFYIAASKELAKQSKPDYLLEEELHTALFTKLTIPEKAMLARLHDVKANTKFSAKDLPAFHSELTHIMADFLHRQVFSVLFHLATLTEKAIAEKADIFVLAE